MSKNKIGKNILSSSDQVLKSYSYVEIHRIREKVVAFLQEQDKKTVLITGAHDNCGNTFLVSALGLNAASYTSMRVLLMDLNMRHPQLHIPFGLKLSTGFSEFASGSLNWKETIKNTGLSGLKVMTAGRAGTDLSHFLKPSLVENLTREMKEYFDLIFIDSSPVLLDNKNNVDPALLSLICDMSILVIQHKKTTKFDLKNAVNTITQGGGKISGIVYNRND